MPRPDWNQNDPTKADYILNKPDLSKVGTPEVVTAYYNAEGDYLDFNFEELVDAFHSGKVVILNHSGFDMATHHHYYCVKHDFASDCLIFIQPGVDYTEAVYVTADGIVDRKTISNGGGGSVELDTTLTQEGKAADAKAVGDAIGGIESALDAIIEIQNSLIGGEQV
jgi:hypothetical protein